MSGKNSRNTGKVKETSENFVRGKNAERLIKTAGRELSRCSYDTEKDNETDFHSVLCWFISIYPGPRCQCRFCGPFTLPETDTETKTDTTRKSSCVNARGIPPAAYQVLAMLGGGGTRSQVRRGGTQSQVWGGTRSQVWGGVPSPRSGGGGKDQVHRTPMGICVVPCLCGV